MWICDSRIPGEIRLQRSRQEALLSSDPRSYMIGSVEKTIKTRVDSFTKLTSCLTSLDLKLKDAREKEMERISARAKEMILQPIHFKVIYFQFTEED